MRQSSTDASGGDPRHRCGETTIGAGRKAGEHVIFGEPAWSARALHHKLARLAVPRLEMTPIAGRHFDSGRGGDVEAGFVMQKDNMRQFAQRMASRSRRRIEAFGDAGVRFEISV